ncbi:MAG TPA: glycosyltransferase [Solirubrobacteraceae bacterium]|nr:glycosyltransferase [Solirubrobacteraceae bacterium]
MAPESADVLLVSLGSTAGLRASDEELAASLRRAGASVVVAAAEPPPQVRTFALTDLRWARAAARAARAALARERPRAIVYSTTTAALLWPAPGAIRYDAPAAATRPGRHGIWQRPLEARRVREAPLLIPTAPGTLAETPEPHADAVIVPIPVEPSGLGEPWALREVAALTYAADPQKKGLDRVLAAWAAARREGERLVVAGLEPERLPDPPPGVEVPGPMDREAYRALLRRARVFVTAPRREDYGIAQLEALADGCVLVTTPAPGPYAALEIARELDPRLVSDELAPAIRAALDDPAPRYVARSIDLLAPYTRAAVDRVVAGELLPRLLG